MQDSIAPLILFTGLHENGLDCIPISHRNFAIEIRKYPSFGQPARVPFLVDRISTPGSQTLDLSVRPGIREGREKMYFTIVALQKHLRYTCGPPKVAIDLKRWVCVEQIGVSTTSVVSGFPRRIHIIEMGLQHPVGMIPIQETGPEIDLPGFAPACAAIPSELQ